MRPRGPYCLAGYCEDAKVAMEVGWQLQAAGEQVGCLLLIDAVWFLHKHRPVLDERFARARKLARNVQRFGLDFVRHRLERRRRYAREDLRLKLCELETACPPPAGRRRALATGAPGADHPLLRGAGPLPGPRLPGRGPPVRGRGVGPGAGRAAARRPERSRPSPATTTRSWRARACWTWPATCAGRWPRPTRLSGPVRPPPPDARPGHGPPRARRGSARSREAVSGDSARRSG